MAGEIVGAITSLKGALDILSGLIAARDLKKFSAQLIEMQEKIIAGHMGISTLQDQLLTVKDEKRDLEDKIREFENWRAEAERYELKDFGGQTFAYVVKEAMRNSEPVHYLCAACMQKREKSILQRITSGGLFECHNCKSRVDLGQDPPRRPSGYRPAGGGGKDGWMA